MDRRQFFKAAAGVVGIGVGGPALIRWLALRQTAELGNRVQALDQAAYSQIRTDVKPEGVDLAVAEGDPAKATEAAIQALGGIERYVRKGDQVAISPNIAFMQDPEVGATTHPAVLRKVVELCERAGASKIMIADYALDDADLSAMISGADEALAGTKAQRLLLADERMFRPVPVTGVKEPQVPFNAIAQPVLDSDVFICLPVCKSHSAAKISFSLKKLMGVIYDRNIYHRRRLHHCIAELNATLRPTLVIMDASRCLQTHGPKGPGELTYPNKIIAGVDPVAVDAYSVRFLEKPAYRPDEVEHLQIAYEMGLGEMNVEKLRVEEVVV